MARSVVLAATWAPSCIDQVNVVQEALHIRTTCLARVTIRPPDQQIGADAQGQPSSHLA